MYKQPQGRTYIEGESDTTDLIARQIYLADMRHCLTVDVHDLSGAIVRNTR